MSFTKETMTTIFNIKTNSMNELFAKLGTISAYTLTIIKLDLLTGILACILSLAMSLYYFSKWQNERIKNKRLKDGCSDSNCAIKEFE